LLHKNPARCHTSELSVGTAFVFYPEQNQERCTVALLLEIDPIGLVRGWRGGGEALEQYVNDRPYVASSFLSVALSKVFRTAMTGESKERPELASTPIPLEARLAVLPCRGGESFLRGLFEPLGYDVEAEGMALDEKFPEWGQSKYFTVNLRKTGLLKDLLTHLYVLIPVLDDEKHYWVSDDEVEKLLRHGKDWLAGHPERERIADRYLKHRSRLARSALARLLEEEQPDADVVAEDQSREEAVVEEQIGLAEQRIGAVLSALKSCGATSVADLGCGDGRLLVQLLAERSFERILGMDVSYRTIERAHQRLHWDQMPPRKKERISLIQGSLTYRDSRLSGYDAAVLMEVIEHMDVDRLTAFGRVVFEFARPGAVIVTTPNVEYNVKFEGLPTGEMRHRDHRFEWTRAEFQAWAQGAANLFAYGVRFVPVGPDDPGVGSPTQMAVFNRDGGGR
jgi:3' terminal RNA ribose 2'-O-methyltransferase Hen1